jgi:hypothetical protein
MTSVVRLDMRHPTAKPDKGFLRLLPDVETKGRNGSKRAQRAGYQAVFSKW